MSGFFETIAALLPSAVGARLSKAICQAYASMPIDGMLNPIGDPPPRPSGSIQQPPVQQPPVQLPPVQQPPVQLPPLQQPPVQQPPVQQPPLQQPPLQQAPVQQPRVPNNMQDVLARQQARDDMLERNRVVERVRLRDQAHQSLAQFSNGTSLNDAVIHDPDQIGVRGYTPAGPNQPYANNIANELVNQNTVGIFKEPALDPNARRFLARVLPQFRPDVYGPNATLSRPTTMISRGDITKLRNLN